MAQPAPPAKSQPYGPCCRACRERSEPSGLSYGLLCVANRRQARLSSPSRSCAMVGFRCADARADDLSASLWPCIAVKKRSPRSDLSHLRQTETLPALTHVHFIPRADIRYELTP